MRADISADANSSSTPDRKSWKYYKLAMVVLALVALIYVAARRLPRNQTSERLNPLASKGREAPNFALSAPDGRVVRLSDYRGKAVLINFFGTTCVPCRQESPHLAEMQRRDSARGFAIIGIEMYGSSNAAIEKFRKEFGTEYVLVHGDDAVGDLYGVTVLPVSYFVNAKGTIVASTVGLHPEQEMDSYVEKVIRGE